MAALEQRVLAPSGLREVERVNFGYSETNAAAGVIVVLDQALSANAETRLRRGTGDEDISGLDRTMTRYADAGV